MPDRSEEMNVLQRYWPCFTGYRATNDAVRIPPQWRQKHPQGYTTPTFEFHYYRNFKGRGPVYIKSPDTGYEKAIPLSPQKKMQQSANGPTATPNRNNYKLHFYSLSPVLQPQRNAIMLPYDKKKEGYRYAAALHRMNDLSD